MFDHNNIQEKFGDHMISITKIKTSATIQNEVAIIWNPNTNCEHIEIVGNFGNIVDLQKRISEAMQTITDNKKGLTNV